MSISRSSALSTNVVLVFDIHDINGGLFLNTTLSVFYHVHLEQQLKYLFYLLQQYMHHYSHTSQIEVLNLTS